MDMPSQLLSQKQALGPPPRLKERYRLVEWLGEGSMGLVYRAHDEMLDRDVAIKFLSPKQITNREASERFVREARTVARLAHPNLVTLFDVDRDDLWHYLILEYIPGQNLHARLAETTSPLTMIETVDIIRAVLEALAYAHSQQIIHRDIKPENVMITPDGQVKVADFGLALGHGDVRLTQDDMIVGTVLYLAPEVVAGEASDHRADLYAVGAMLYELLTGQPPFSSDNPMAIFSQILNAPLTAPRTLNATIPITLDRVVTTLLAKEPQARYASAEAVLEALPDLTQETSSIFDETASTIVEQPQPRDIQASRLERIVRNSSTTLPSKFTTNTPFVSDEASFTTPELSQALLLYAALDDTVGAVEAERQRLAHLLQGNIVEALNLLLSQANAYEQTMAANPTARMAFSVMVSLVRQVIQEVRDLGDNLHPATLETLGLEPALEALANQMQRAHGLTVDLHLERLEDRLPRQTELALFRTAQDALERAVNYSHASHVVLHLDHQEDNLQFRITDNATTDNNEPDEGLAILDASRQRIEQLGGTVAMQYTPRGHFELLIHFTLAPPIQLTPREMDVIQLLTEGLANKEIAQRLSVTPRTVNFHLDNIYAKLGVNSRTEAAIYALRQGWATSPV